MPTMTESRTQTFCLIILAAVAITVALIYTKPVFVPLVFSLFFYAAALPVVRFLQVQIKMPRALAVVLTCLGFVISNLLITYVVVSSIEEFAEGIPSYQSQLVQLTDFVSDFAKQLGYSLDVGFWKEELKKLASVSRVKALTGGVFSLLGNVFLIFVFFLFLILGESGNSKNPLVVEVQNKISRYITAKTLVSLGTGFLSGVVFFSFNVELAFMFAVLTALLNFIPNIGSLVAMVIPIPVLLLQFGVGWEFFVVVGLCVAIQTIIGNVIEPKMMGESMGLHPITVLVFLVFWGLVWGVAGMFLAVPITAILKIILSRIEPTRGIAELLAGRISIKS